MLEIEQNAVKKALLMLTAAKCTFAVIDPDGNKHGTLDIMPTKRKRSCQSVLPFGMMTEHAVKHMGKLQPGEAVLVPIIENVSVKALRSCMTSWASHAWGNGSYMSSANKDQTGVEILRLS
jgi:hypothetical protein